MTPPPVKAGGDFKQNTVDELLVVSGDFKGTCFFKIIYILEVL